MENIEIRDAMKIKRVRQWQIAEQLKISETKLSRMMRREMSDEQKKQVMEAIKSIV